MSGYGLSHVGKVRQRNEDALSIDPDGHFALIADGMGGHKGGMEASRMTIARVSEELGKDFARLQKMNEVERHRYFRDLFQQTSREVYEHGVVDHSLSNMGTTLVVWVSLGAEFLVAHVGDSRGYLIRDNGIYQLTMDHTFVNEQIAAGAERDEIFNGASFRNAIFRNIGMMPPSVPGILCGEICAGDVWVLCTDGLSNKMSSEEIFERVRNAQDAHAGKPSFLADACRGLVELALDRGGEDNISVLVLKTTSLSS
jgi:protein phosphatase